MTGPRQAILLLSCALLLAPGCTRRAADEGVPATPVRVDNFGLYDQSGAFHHLHYHADAAAVVLFVQGNGCPIVRNSLPALRAVRDAFAPRGVVFYGLNANPQDTRPAIRAEADAFGIDFPVLVDDAQLVAEGLGLTRTAEVLVIDPKTWTLLYRGPVDDRLGYEAQRSAAGQHYLADALEAHLGGRTVPVAARPAKGCLIALPRRAHSDEAGLTYVRDVAPILRQRCQSCHRPGGIGPWAMTGYDVVRGWSPMIREVVRTRRMPPWHADPHVGTFANDLSLTTAEMRTIVRWVEAGAPRGDGADPLADLPAAPSAWPLGEPDLTFQLARQEIPATGVLDYRYEQVAVPLERDAWVRAVDVMPGNRAVLHHVLVSVTYPDGFTPHWQRRDRWLDGVFAAYAPGAEPEVFPEGTGRFLPAGSELVFQLHYTTTGRPEADSTRFALYLADAPPGEELVVVGPANTRIAIPPGAGAYEAVAEETFEDAVTLHSFFPHMHFRGKSMRYEAYYPDGTSEVLFSVPNYNFNWQRTYSLAQPRLLPAGTRIVCRAVYDNSARNPFNPAPQDTVRWGEQSFDEMLIGYMAYSRGRHPDAVTGAEAGARVPVPASRPLPLAAGPRP